MSEMGFENVFYLESFECEGNEVCVESTPPASPAAAPALMAARLATAAQNGGTGSPSPSNSVRELIVIPEISDSIHLQHAIQQVSNTVVEVNGGDSSGHSSPNTDPHHTYITVASSEGSAVNYHVQYVESQELYGQEAQPHMEGLRTYPVYNVTSVEEGGGAGWAGAETGEGAMFAAGDGAGAAAEGGGGDAPASPAAPHHPPRMPPATVQWLLDNYETADGVSLPRSTLYAHYLRHCTTHNLDPVNAASFGKLIRSVFIGLRTRRLGTRGNSKYHYYGIRAKPRAGDSPTHDDLDDQDKNEHEYRDRPLSEAQQIGGGNSMYRQYLGSVTAPTPPPPPLADLSDRTKMALQQHFRNYATEFLEAIAALDASALGRARRSFWRRTPRDLPRRDLHELFTRTEMVSWLSDAEFQLSQRAVELLLPHVLTPIPPQLTQSIRALSKIVESHLTSGSQGAPAVARKVQRRAGAALAAALRRYTSLNHLAQAARAVLANKHQIQQMVSDLSRVDFRVVREQAAWACACAAPGKAQELEHDFKSTLSRGASLEQWAGWLEQCVSLTLEPHLATPNYTARAKRLLLDWCFYSSLVIRELTLRSAASFGSFHLIRLLYDEYVSYLVERRVAEHKNVPPIAVMHADNEDEESPEPDADPTQEAEAPGSDDDNDPDWEWDDDEEDNVKRPREE